MSDQDMTQRAFTTILAHFVATGRAPHYTELADTLDVDLDTAVGCMPSPFARSRAGSGAVN